VRGTHKLAHNEHIHTYWWYTFSDYYYLEISSFGVAKVNLFYEHNLYSGQSLESWKADYIYLARSS
jgi:hypothetical protein